MQRQTNATVYKHENSPLEEDAPLFGYLGRQTNLQFHAMKQENSVYCHRQRKKNGK